MAKLNDSSLFHAFQNSKSNRVRVMATEVQSRNDQQIEMTRLYKNTKKVVNFVQDTIESRTDYLLYIAKEALGYEDQHNYIAAKDKLIKVGETGGWRFRKLVTALKMWQVTTENCHSVTCSYEDSRKEVLTLMGLIK